jgi:hypothetical protein
LDLAEHGEAGLTAGHDVGMIAEDVQRVCRDGTGGNVEHGRELLACDLVHVGDHQQQALGGGEGGSHCACCKSTVHSTCGTAFGLHFPADAFLVQILPSGNPEMQRCFRHVCIIEHCGSAQECDRALFHKDFTVAQTTPRLRYSGWMGYTPDNTETSGYLYAGGPEKRIADPQTEE